MNNIHPSEKEIQQYALDKMDSNPVITAHIDSCSRLPGGGFNLSNVIFRNKRTAFGFI